MAIVFWSSSEAKYLERTVKPVADLFKPHVSWCRAMLENKLLMPEAGGVVVVMGDKALSLLRMDGRVHKSAKVSSLRGTPIVCKETGGVWLVTYDPFLIEREEDALFQIQWDTALAHRWATTGSLDPVVGKYEYVSDFSVAIDCIRKQFANTGKRVRVALDLETLSFDYVNPQGWVISISISWESGKSHVITFPKMSDIPCAALLEQIEHLTQDDSIALVGANLKFDILWMKFKWGVPWPKNFRLDTLLVGSLIDENRSNSLNTHAKIASSIGGYDDSFNDKADKSRMDLELAKDPAGFLTYAGGDTDAAWQVAGTWTEILKQDPDLLKFYVTVLHPAARAFERIEARGILVDVPKLKELAAEAKQEIVSQTELMTQLVPMRIQAKYSDDFKFSRPSILKDLFFSKLGWDLQPKMWTEGTQWKYPKQPDMWEISTADTHLKQFASHPKAGPWVAARRRAEKAKKILTTYIGVADEKGQYEKGFLAHLRADGRFHPSYFLFHGQESAEKDQDGGTNTGRSSAKGPAIQTLPKRDKRWAKALRRCYPAPPGRLWWQADMNQGELRIAACLSNDPTMIQAYKDGKDLHTITGAKLGGITFEELVAMETGDPASYVDIRTKAKASNFGMIYDISADGFVEFAFKAYDLVITSAEAQEMIDAFFGLYSNLRGWHKACRDFAMEHRYVVSPLGRIRHLPLMRSKDRKVASKAGRQAINSPVQGCLSDMVLWAASIIELETDLPDRGTEITMFTHDALGGYVPDTSDGVDQIREVARIMSNLPLKKTFGWDHQLQFPVDAEFGPTLGDLAKLPKIS